MAAWGRGQPSLHRQTQGVENLGDESVWSVSTPTGRTDESKLPETPGSLCHLETAALQPFGVSVLE